MVKSTNLSTTIYDESGVLKKRRKRRAATNALREIKREQKRTNHIIPIAPFNRLVQELAADFTNGDLRFKANAYEAFHTAAEDYLIKLFGDANEMAIHARRETVQPKDLRLAQSKQ